MPAERIKSKLIATFSAAATGLKRTFLKSWKKTPTAFKAIASIVIALNAGWQLYSRLNPPVQTPPKEKPAIILPEKVIASVIAPPEVPRKEHTVVKPVPKEKKPSPLIDKPSIAVLPFANTSGDPKYENISDGITDEIINSLGRLSQLLVIARNVSSRMRHFRQEFSVQRPLFSRAVC